METLKRPLVRLNKSLNNYVIVKLKSDLEYRGRLAQCDNFMNLILNGATEYNSGEPIAEYGNIFIRGNNIIYVCVDASQV